MKSELRVPKCCVVILQKTADCYVRLRVVRWLLLVTSMDDLGDDSLYALDFFLRSGGGASV